MLGLTRLILVLFYDSIHVNRRAFYIILVNSLSDGIFIIIILIYTTTNKLQTLRLLILIIILIRITKSAI